jgi:hypothetical protein
MNTNWRWNFIFVGMLIPNIFVPEMVSINSKTETKQFYTYVNTKQDERHQEELSRFSYNNLLHEQKITATGFVAFLPSGIHFDL